MNRSFRLLNLLLLLGVVIAQARGRVEGWCENGNQVVVTPGVQNSTTKTQRSYPGCTINVYLPGTTNAATLYSNITGTSLGNPFTASLSTGYWYFYTDSPLVDVNFSGAGISAPFTRGSVPAIDPIPELSDAGFPSFSTACSVAHSAGQTLILGSVWQNLSNQTCSASIRAVAGGSIQPGTGQTITLTGSIQAGTYKIFDTSLGGAGSILISGPVPQIFVNWFGTGAANDYPSWASAIASCPSTGCNLALSDTSTVTTTIAFNLSGPSNYVRVTGGNAASSIQCTGITCVSWTGSNAFSDSGMENISIVDPTGNTSTIGLSVGGGTCCTTNTRIYFRNMVISGASGAPEGTGVYLENTVLPRFQNVTIKFWGNGVTQSGTFVNSWWNQCEIVNNSAIGWNILSGGDSSASQCDYESNGTYGIYMGSSVNNVSVMQSHFESNSTDQIDQDGGMLFTTFNTVAGGTVHLKNTTSGTSWTSYSDNLGGVTITNNAPNGGSGLPPLLLPYPLLSPTVNGSGWSQIFGPSGFTQTNSPAFYTTSGAIAEKWSDAQQFNSSVAMNGSINTSQVVFNLAQECTTTSTYCSGASANYALTASLIDAFGVAVSLGNSSQVTIVASHSLRVGANTLNLNNTGALPILRPQDGDQLTTAWTSGRYTFINVGGAGWLLVGGN